MYLVLAYYIVPWDFQLKFVHFKNILGPFYPLFRPYIFYRKARCLVCLFVHMRFVLGSGLTGADCAFVGAYLTVSGVWYGSTQCLVFGAENQSAISLRLGAVIPGRCH